MGTFVFCPSKSKIPFFFAVYAPCGIIHETLSDRLINEDSLEALVEVTRETECWTTTPTRPPRPLVSVHPPSAREIPTTRRRTRPRSERKSPKAHRRPLGSALTRHTGLTSRYRMRV